MHGDNIIPDSSDIADYLAATYPATAGSMFPSDPKQLGLAHCLSRMCDEAMFPILLYYRYVRMKLAASSRWAKGWPAADCVRCVLERHQQTLANHPVTWPRDAAPGSSGPRIAPTPSRPTSRASRGSSASWWSGGCGRGWRRGCTCRGSGAARVGGRVCGVCMLGDGPGVVYLCVRQCRLLKLFLLWPSSPQYERGPRLTRAKHRQPVGVSHACHRAGSAADAEEGLCLCGGADWGRPLPPGQEALLCGCDAVWDDRHGPVVRAGCGFRRVRLSACLLVCLSVLVCLSACLLVCLSACLLVCLSACLLVCLSAGFGREADLSPSTALTLPVPPPPPNPGPPLVWNARDGAPNACVRDAVREHPNLVAFAARIRAEYFKEFGAGGVGKLWLVERCILQRGNVAGCVTSVCTHAPASTHLLRYHPGHASSAGVSVPRGSGKQLPVAAALWRCAWCSLMMIYALAAAPFCTFWLQSVLMQFFGSTIHMTGSVCLYSLMAKLPTSW